MNLFDTKIDYYVLKEKWWDWGSGDIYNKAGISIGSMHRRVITLRKFIEISEKDGTVLFTVNRKIVSLRPSSIIKDANGNILGRTNKKILTFFRPKLWLEDKNGNKLLEAKGNFLGRSFEIKDTKGKLIAKIGKSDFFKDMIFGGVFDFSDTYAIKIINLQYDRRLLLGLVIAIDNSVHRKKR